MANSSIKRILISNIGPFGEDPITVDMSDIVCLVGQNNAGKSTVLDCYELILGKKAISESKIHKNAKVNPYVELWIEIPFGTPNIGDEWIKVDYEDFPDTPILRSRWTWSLETLSVQRTTFDKGAGIFSEDSKAGGLDNVFNSRLPKPLRIGALEQPEDQKAELLKIVLDPIIKNLKQKALEQGTPLNTSIGALKTVLKNELTNYQTMVDEVEGSLRTQYSAVFDSHNVHIEIEPHDNFFDIDSYLKKATDIFIEENGHLLPIKSQGTGSQRTLFWSLLKVRSALQSKLDAESNIIKSKKDKEKQIEAIREKISKLESSQKALSAALTKSLAENKQKLEELENAKEPSNFERGCILMIDEPEIALHPSAVRLAKNQLYNLAKDKGWQVLLTTHHPAFIDPAQDHTTIVRVDKNASGSKVFKSEIEKFDEDEKHTLAALLRFDGSFSEIFFSKEVIIVEGDTEYSVFQELFNLDGTPRNINERAVVRAGGKGTIPLILRILRHFKIPHGVLHDIDSPKTSGGRKNSAYTINQNILSEIKKTIAMKVPIYHCISVPNFEKAHSIFSSGDGKPLDVAKKYKTDEDFKKDISLLAKQLTGKEKLVYEAEKYEEILKKWVVDNKLDSDPRYKFD